MNREELRARVAEALTESQGPGLVLQRHMGGPGHMAERHGHCTAHGLRV